MTSTEKSLRDLEKRSSSCDVFLSAFSSWGLRQSRRHPFKLLFQRKGRAKVREGPNQKGFILSFHDVAPHTFRAFAEFAEVLETEGVSCFTWLIVPLWHGRYLITPQSPCAVYLRGRQSRGDALVSHGLTHRWERSKKPRSAKDLFTARCYTSRESEFLGVGKDELRRRVEKSRDLLEEAGLHASGFVAPAWIFPPSGYEVLKSLGFAVTESYTKIYSLQNDQKIRAPVVTASSRTRLRAFLSRFVMPALEGLYAGVSILRVAIHPADLDHPAIRRLILRLVRKLCRQRQPHTLLSWLKPVVL